MRILEGLIEVGKDNGEDPSALAARDTSWAMISDLICDLPPLISTQPYLTHPSTWRV